jgi:NDP-sugar pyrophosphorylase family protein
MPLDDVPVIEILVEQLRQHGVRQLTVVTGHLAELIRAFLGDGQRFGMRIRYLKEEAPLDTAGCLGLIDRPPEPFLVMNGDLLTTLDFTRMMCFHRRHHPLATVAAYRRQVKIDLGVLDIRDDDQLGDYIEKPSYDFFVSMGVYCFDPKVCEYVRAGERVSMPALILRLRDAGALLKCYREECYWLDIGRPDDYARAIEEFRTDRSRFFPTKQAAA